MLGLIAGLTCGISTFYGMGDGFHGQRTANGERFDAYRWTAAHPLKNTTVALPVVAKNETTVVAE